MTRGLVLRNGTDIDVNWKDRMIVDIAPMAITPTTFASSLSAGGSLTNGAYFYKVCAMGINGESTASSEQTKVAGGGNNTINLTWDAQTFVTEYRVYRGTASGVYDGYFRVFTNSLTDDGTLDMVTMNGKVPTALNHETGVALGGAFVGNAQREFLFFSEITIHGSTYVPYTDNGVTITPQMAVIHLKKSEKVILDIDLSEVLIPASWNTPNSDAGINQALADIQDWATV